MTIKQKILVISTNLLLFTAIPLVAPSTALAATPRCGGTDTAIISCDANNKGVCPDGKKKDVGDTCSDGSKATADITNNGVWGLLILAINILTAGVAIAAVGGIIYGSILYTSAGDNEGQVKKAKEIIQNVVIGLIAYVAMYALIQFIIPGGVFS